MMRGQAPGRHPNVAHLSDDEIALFLRAYYAGDKVAALMDTFAISGSPSHVIAMMPATVTEDECPYCDSQSLFRRPTARARRGENYAFCPACKHEGSDRWCQCPGCKDLRNRAFTQEELKAAIAEANKNYAIEKAFPVPNCSGVSPLHLTLLQAVSFLAVFDHSAAEDLASVDPYQRTTTPLAPDGAFKKCMVEGLYARGLIAVDPRSPVDAFVFSDDVSSVEGFYNSQVSWLLLPGMSDDEKKTFISTLQVIARDGEWPATWADGMQRLWHDIAVAECLEYYSLLLDQRGYDADLGEKAQLVLANLLRHFSPGQVFNLTWQAVRDTSDYIVKNNLGWNHARNTFIGSVQRKGDRAIAAGWDVKVSRRDFNCPQSEIGSVFADVFFGVGERWLETKVPMPQDDEVGESGNV